MEISRMTIGIIKYLNNNYDVDSLDVKQIIDLCSIYKISDSHKKGTDIMTDDLYMSSPNFKKSTKTDKKTKLKIDTDEFKKKYAFFIKIIYSCLRLNIQLFNETDDGDILKNNYQLLKSLEKKKKDMITDHMNILKSHCHKLQEDIDDNYSEYVENYIKRMKIIQNIMNTINKLLTRKIMEKTDNLLNLLLPYFYSYNRYIESYGI
jgi:hypothetical protein